MGKKRTKPKERDDKKELKEKRKDMDGPPLDKMMKRNRVIHK